MGNELVVAKNNKPVTTSLKVAEAFERQHKDVLKAIKNLDCSDDFNERNFAPVKYIDSKGEERPCYEMTRDGFTFLAMGFTGKKAAEWKEKYIAAFNAMEAELKKGHQSKTIKKPTRSRIANDLAANIKIAKIFGLKGNQALLSANRMTANQYIEFDVDPLLEAGVELETEDKIQYFTPTELGKQAGGLSAKEVNQTLKQAGFQEETRGTKNKLIWLVTEKGTQHCQMLDTGKKHSDGTPVIQIKWLIDVLNYLTETKAA